jgi:G3E family GTPase
MEEISLMTGDAFDFRGMVYVVDASRFSLLASVVNAIEEQIAYSRFIVVNEADLVSDSALAGDEPMARREATPSINQPR